MVYLRLELRSFEEEKQELSPFLDLISTSSEWYLFLKLAGVYRKVGCLYWCSMAKCTKFELNEVVPWNNLNELRVFLDLMSEVN